MTDGLMKTWRNVGSTTETEEHHTDSSSIHHNNQTQKHIFSCLSHHCKLAWTSACMFQYTSVYVYRKPDHIKITSAPLKHLRATKEVNKHQSTININTYTTLQSSHTHTQLMEHNVSYCTWWSHGVDGPIARGLDRERWTVCCVNVCRGSERRRQRGRERMKDVFEKTNQHTHVLPVHLSFHVWPHPPPTSHVFHVSCSFTASTLNTVKGKIGLKILFII